jgi:hypothetical protein
MHATARDYQFIARELFSQGRAWPVEQLKRWFLVRVLPRYGLL